MNRDLVLWLAIVIVGALNYAARLSFIALFSRRDIPPLLARCLRHVPAAMLTAIVVPAIVFVAPGVTDFRPENSKLLAALAAGVVAWQWQNTTLTIGVGMVVLWSLQYMGS